MLLELSSDELGGLELELGSYGHRRWIYLGLVPRRRSRHRRGLRHLLGGVRVVSYDVVVLVVLKRGCLRRSRRLHPTFGRLAV